MKGLEEPEGASQIDAPAPPRVGRFRAFWQHRVIDLAVAQLRQGITPQKIALSVALGLAFGVFPIMGTTTALCLVVGVWLRLNQPIIQLASWLAWPIQIPGIYFFIRTGEWLTRVAPEPFSISAMLVAFKAAPLRFLQQFGMLGLRGVLGWALITPPLALLIYLLALPPLKRLAAARRPAPID
jgi:uncharacterized protein (DUF2062 family)